MSGTLRSDAAQRPATNSAGRKAVLFLLAATAFSVGAVFLASQSASQTDVLARVNGKEITQADIDFASKMYSAQLGTAPDDARRSMTLDPVIETRVIADRAKADGIDKSEEYRRQMAFFEGQVLRSIYMDRAVAAAVSDEAVTSAYEKQVAAVPPAKELRASHILFGSEIDAQDAIMALKRGEDFATLAKQLSRDEASKAAGGDLGFVAVGQGLPEIELAAAALQPGQYTQAPVKSAFGYHVVRLEEQRDRPAPTFEAVQAGIRQSLEAEEGQKIAANLLAKAAVEKFVPHTDPPQGGHENDGAAASDQ